MIGHRRNLAALISAMVVVNLVFGLTLPLLSLVLDDLGTSKTVIGLSVMAQACAGLVIAPVVPRLLTRFGAGTLMRGAALLAAATLLLLGSTAEVALWFPLRFLLGVAGSVMWSCSEAEINELVDEQWRGRIIGLYGAAGAVGFALGPLVLMLTGSDGMLPFAVTAALVMLTSLPLLWMRPHKPARQEPNHPSLLRIFRLAPEIMLLNLVYAAAIEAFIAFFPLFGIEAGIGERRSLALLTLFGFGGVVLQLPLGWLADHMDRRRMLLGCLLLTGAGFVALPGLVGTGAPAAGFMFVLGGVEGMIYAMGVILLGQRFRGVELATASVLFTGMWGAGTMVGPALVGAGMDLFGAGVLPLLVAAIYAVYLPLLLRRGSAPDQSGAATR